ncbi:2-dehydro-3-deoxygalactonokinase [Lewinella sp. IMCC34183]|uniref:2-dehydro-3-deoxygalactonokinase n=1 Tax=Lewinella sp. IMCC34183 TaxID=2248762 RepID=UPI000E249653|nr:2-dehydro-3-deoxygalactonokinase [Lewinella sp. IMCC34183]
MSDRSPTAPTHFISCDWGTTNFRLRVVETGSLRTLAGWNNAQGIRTVSAEFLASGEKDRQSYYLRYLADRLSELPPAYGNLPVVASGMASSSIGMRELAYADLPIESDGRGLHGEWLSTEQGHSVLLLSGVKGSDSIMRGEEIQAVGMSDLLAPSGAGTLLLPGTHSKHLYFDGSRYTSFTTYMTGELFELLSTRSVLAASVAAGEFGDEASDAFRKGVRDGSAGKISAALFGVRVRDVLQHKSRIANYYYLSGLLVGNEVGGLRDSDGSVYLVATEPVRTLYQIALETLINVDRIRVFGAEVLERALLFGQLKLLLQYAR